MAARLLMPRSVWALSRSSTAMPSAGFPRPGSRVSKGQPMFRLLAALTGELGFRVDAIFPADAPRTAVVSAHGTRLRLERTAAGAQAPRTERSVPAWAQAEAPRS